jgi:hypothetical protein
MPYHTLLASLPHLPTHFDVPRPPISRLRLEQRLTMLNEHDAAILQQLSDFLTWDRQTMGRSEQDVIEDYNQLHEEIRHPIVLQIIDDRINMRTVVSALRRHRDGQGPPLGVGQLVRPIRDHWNRPQFELGHRFPWIEEFERAMLAGESIAAERILYEHSWRTSCGLASQFQFTFEAVLLYLTRWSIVDRWTSRDEEAGRTRFLHLLDETLGEYARLEM